MKKGLSLLLAFAMVFSVFASVAMADEHEELTPEQMFEELKEKGIFKGIERPDGTVDPGLDEEMNRAQFAEVLTNLFKLERDEDAADKYSDLTGYGWARGSIGAATKAGILYGDPNGTFRPGDQVKFEELASVLVEAFGLEVDEDAEVDGKVSGWAKGYVAAAVAAGLLPEQDDYTAYAIRADLVTVAYAANMKVEEEGNPFEPVPDELAISGVEQVGVKKVEVQFNKAVEDTEAAEFAVERAGRAVEIADVEWSENKKTATLTMKSDLTEGEYTVTVSGLTDEEEGELEATFTVEEEKISKIEFLGDVAALDREDDQYVYVRFAIYNQFGEDVTDEYENDGDIEYSVGNGDFVEVEDGKITIDKDEDDSTDEYDIGDIVTVSILDKETGTYAQANLEVGEYSRVSDVEILGVVNQADPDDVPDASDNANDYYVLIEAYDQYGYKFGTDSADVNAVKEDISVSVTDDDVLDTDEDFLDKVTIDGEDYLGLEVQSMDEAGTATIRIVANASGNTATYEVVVRDSEKVAEFRLSTPANVVAGEKVEIPFTALDAEGNEITDYDSLTDPDNWEDEPTVEDVDEELLKAGGEVTLEFKRDAETGDAILVLDLRDYKFFADENEWEDDKITIEAETDSGKRVELGLTVKDYARPESVEGVSSGFIRHMLSNTYTVLDTDDHIIVYDQYDRPLNMKEYLAAPGSTPGANDKDRYMIQVKSSNIGAVKFGAGTNVSADGSTLIIDNSNYGDKYKLEPASATVLGSSNIEIAILEYKNDNNPATTNDFYVNEEIDSYDFLSRVVEFDDIDEYELKVAEDLFYEAVTDDGNGTLVNRVSNASDYYVDVEVVGKLKNGQAVAIGYDNYVVQASISGETTQRKPGTVEKDVYQLRAEDIWELDDDDKSQEMVITAFVTTDDDTIKLTKTVTVSSEDPEVEIVQLDEQDAVGTDGVDYLIKSADSVEVVAGSYNDVEDILADVVEFIDQYGEDYGYNSALATSVLGSAEYLVTDIQGGANLAAVLSGGGSFKVEVITSNGKSLEIEVDVVDSL